MKTLYFHILVIFLIFLQVSSAPVMCKGQLCESDCDHCNLCNTETCQISKNCHCPSVNIPGDLALQNTPQFVFLSLRGGIKESFINQTNFSTTFMSNDTIVDSLNCPMKPSLYITTDESDYNVINYFQKIGTLGFQSVTNKVSSASTSTQMNAEFSKGLEFLREYGSVNTDNIKLVRNPNLQLSDNYFSVLRNYQFSIDSSISDNPHDSNSTARLWPYTLDFGLHNQLVCKENCPTSTYNGLWEFLIPKLQDNNNESISMYDLQMGNYSTSMELIQKNFLENYQTNKAPFGLVLDLDWFYVDVETVDPVKYAFIQEIYQWMGLIDNVIFATEEEIISWMLNPKTYINTKASFKCRESFEFETTCGSIPPVECDYPNDRSSLKICLTGTNRSCPAEYPNIRAQTCGDGVCTLGLDQCSCSDCGGICRPNWPGSISFETTFETKNYMCGSLFYNNPLEEAAMNFIITLKIYWGSLDKVVGAKKVSFENNTKECISETWRLKPYLMSAFYPQTNYSRIQICVNKSKTEFEADFIQLGMEIISPLLNLDQTVIDYDAQCGDDICQEAERHICKVDCFIPFNSLFVKKLGVGILLVWMIFFFWM